MLDLVWADTAANYYEPRGDLSGPHSRDYDTLLGHGIHYVELYARTPRLDPLYIVSPDFLVL